MCIFFFFNDTATTEIYTLSLHDALPISEEVAAARGDGSLLRGARSPGPEEEALHLRAARLAEAAARRGHPAGRAALEGPQDDHSAPARRAAQERAGRASVRAPGFHDPREGRLVDP